MAENGAGKGNGATQQQPTTVVGVQNISAASAPVATPTNVVEPIAIPSPVNVPPRPEMSQLRPSPPNLATAPVVSSSQQLAPNSPMASAPVPLSPRAFLAGDPSAGPSSDFFLLMQNAGVDEDEGGNGLGPPAMPSSPVGPRPIGTVPPSADVRRRKSVVGNIKFGIDDRDDEHSDHYSEGDDDDDHGHRDDRSFDLDARPQRVDSNLSAQSQTKAPSVSTTSLSTDRKGMNLEYLVKWQENQLRPNKKETENGIYKSSTGSSRLSSYEIPASPPADRFTLYSPALSTPITSSTFNFSPSLLTAQPWFWIDVLDVTDSEMLMFSRVFHLHPLTSEDIVEGRVRRDGFGQVGNEGREKMEIFPGYYFVLMRALDPQEDELSNADAADEVEGVNLNIVVSMNGTKEAEGESGPYTPWILSFHSRPLNAPRQVQARHTMLQSYDMSAGIDWICYALLDAVCDAFAPEIKSTEIEAESIDGLVLMLRKESQEELLRRINESKRRVTALMKLLQGKPATIKSMRRRLMSHFTDLGISELALYLSDVGDNVVGMQSSLQFQEATLARAHGTYLARVQIEIQGSTASSYDMTNRVTLLASIIVPFNLLTGMMGMNLRVPFQTTDDNPSLLPFIGMSVMIGCIIAAVLIFSKYKGMI